MVSLVSTEARNLLRKIADAEDGELVYEKGGGWWVDDHQTSGKVAFELLRFCLLHQEHEMGATFERYTVNEDGRALLADAEHEPLIVASLRKK